MPIGETHRSGSSFTGLCQYVLAQGNYSSDEQLKKPEVIMTNFIFENNYLEIGKEFRQQASENKKVRKPVMHLSINFKTDDRISVKKQEQFVKRVMEEMGIKDDNHQYLVVRHNDKHPHYHVVVNRVGLDGITLSDSFSKYKIGIACDKVEKEMKLDNYLEESRIFIYDKETNSYKKNENRKSPKAIIKVTKNREIGLQQKKNFIQIQTKELLRNRSVCSFEILKQELAYRNIDFKYNINKKNQVAVSFHYDGIAVKGSQISFRGNLIAKQLKFNADAYSIQEAKDSFLDINQSAKDKFEKCINLLVKDYNSGFKPNIKELFLLNNIELSNDFNSLRYKVFDDSFATITDLNLVEFITDCDCKLQEAKLTLKSKIEAYLEIQNTKYTEGLFGLLSPEHKKFNSELEYKKKNTKFPELQVDISSDEYIKKISVKFDTLANQVNAINSQAERAYSVSNEFDSLDRNGKQKIEKVEPVSESKFLNTISRGSTTSSDEEDLERQRRRPKRRR